MAWEWSHTSEAYHAVYANIAAQEREWLEVVWSEWQALRGEDGFDQLAYDVAKQQATRFTAEALVEAVWEKTNEQALCSNGGWEAYCCPYSCCCHTVPFDIEDKEQEQ